MGILWATMMNTHSFRKQGDKVFQPEELFGGVVEESAENLDFDQIVNRWGRKIKKDNAK